MSINAIRRRKLVSDFRVNTRRKCMAFCSFFTKFEILKANIVGMSLVHKVFIFSKSSSSIGQLFSRYRQTSIFKTPSDNMFALNHFMCCQAISPLWFSFLQQCIIVIILIIQRDIYIRDSNACLKKCDVQVSHDHLNAINEHIQFAIKMPSISEKGESIAFLDTSNTVLKTGQITVNRRRWLG